MVILFATKHCALHRLVIPSVRKRQPSSTSTLWLQITSNIPGIYARGYTILSKHKVTENYHRNDIYVKTREILDGCPDCSSIIV